VLKKAKDSLLIKRHSSAHILASVIKKHYPQAKLGIGPSIADGFYYDFKDLDIKEKDLPNIEQKMRELIKQDITFSKKQVSIEEAKSIFKDEPFKLELIKELSARGHKKVCIYQSGDFVDLCEGPHIKASKELNPQGLKLLKLAGAYWKGKETNPMLLRIYGTYFDKEEDLAKFEEKIKEAEKRNHQVLNKKSDLFAIYPESIGSGLIVWHPNGSIIRQQIEDFWKKIHQKQGYELVYSPHIGRLELWKRSGHFSHYKEMMYAPMKMPDETYLLKPMNCPFHIEIYRSKQRSYKDLPIKYAELGTVYRYEKKGVLLGLLRVRGFTQDDAHIFCQEDQLEQEIEKVIDLAFLMLKVFGFKDFEVEMALRGVEKDKNYIGAEENWLKAENALRQVLKKKKIKFKEGIGEAKFYGPSIDIKTLDVLGRSWQGPTIQVDFNLPEKFDLYYINQKGAKVRPVMIHRTVLGAMERFIGSLIENFGGAFPLWLCPIQVAIVSVADKYIALAEKIKKELEDFRVEIFASKDSVSKKIRQAEEQKIPYILVVGEKEKKILGSRKLLPVRLRGGQIQKMTLSRLKNTLAKKVQDKSLDL